MTSPGYRFVAPPAYATAGGAPRRLDPGQARVVAHRFGPLLVHGGPGTGKTTTLVESVAARVDEGVPPQDILVLGFGRRGSARLRHRIAARLGRTGAEVAVHSFPAFAFALLRLAAARRGAPPPRLLKGPEQDVVIRELLAADDVAWPDSVTPALATRAFVEQLHDVLQRATERGISAPRLAELGRVHDRPEWVAAADFLTRYVDVLALSSLTGAASYDAAEIIRAAAHELASDPGLIRPPAYVYVDELQEIVPAQSELLRLVAGGGANLVAFGDADSAVFGFRGGDPTVMRDFPTVFPTAAGDPAPEVDLAVCHRSASAPHSAAASVAARLRGSARHRGHLPPPEVGAGDVTVTVLPSGGRQAGYIADVLRRTHLRDGVPWSRMAVLVKSATEHLPQISRALRQAGVPVKRAADDTPLSAQPMVAQLLTVIRCGLNPKLLDEPTAVALLHSPYGGADALRERRLRQELRRRAVRSDVFRHSGELLVEALREPDVLDEFDDADWVAPARRIARLLTVAATATGSVENVLWEVWRAAGVSDRLAALAVSGDSRAEAADSDLDAMMTLFDWAAEFTDRLPGAGPEVFCAHVMEQVIPADSLARHARRGEAVRLTTVHQAKGGEWDVVVVAGVQEGRWPNLRPRGSLMGAEQLVDAAAGNPPEQMNVMAALLEEERRLFHVAVSRARDRLVVTAVSDDDESQPSRFVSELGVTPVEVTALPRALTLPALVAELRTAACGPEGAGRDAAIAQLRRLAEAGVPGADPADWWGLRPLSDERELHLPGERVKVSPSTIERFDQCGLRWILERHGGNEPAGLPQKIGDLVHAAAEAAAGTADPQGAMREFVDRRIGLLPFAAPWKARQDMERVRGMVDKLGGWLADNPRTLVAAEARFTVSLPDIAPGVSAELSGVVDRVERDMDGRLHIVDIKTGTTPITQKEAAVNPQLAAYQLAVEAGAFSEWSDVREPGGASLVYTGTKGASVSVREQPALPDAADPGWARDKVTDVAGRMAGATFLAVHSRRCDTCAVKQCCPISGKGGSVTE
ncbi:ATP-dependent helicase [Stackebrandtia albiflava]|uniref:ATP-dependent helicase n=1 Tax=Stackebrandtia albiflava TaxID=406432 RepID=UPI001B86963A|nr:ATP-dependent DNA helicase [Stackebrandtia albiflava]